MDNERIQRELLSSTCGAYAKRKSQGFDKGHNMTHLTAVLWTVLLHCSASAGNWTIVMTKRVIGVAALFHEFLGKHIPDHERTAVTAEMTVALTADGYDANAQDIILWIVRYCSFSMRHYPERYSKPKYECLMQLVSSADLAEAVGVNAVERSWYWQMYKHNGDAKKARQGVREYIEGGDGIADSYRNRFNAITTQSILQSLIDGDVIAKVMETYRGGDFDVLW